MTTEQQTDIADDQQAQADFDAGIAMETPAPKAGTTTAPKSTAEPAPKLATAQAAAEPKAPAYVQITQEQFDQWQAAAAKTASFDQKLDKAFGTLGNMQKIVNGLREQTPRGLAVELPADVVAEMERDFPELAGHFRAGLEKALKGIKGVGAASAEIDPDRLQKLVTEEAIRREAEALEDAHPNWRDIVGTMNDPANPFRKWLATQDADYQAKINATNSSTIIARAIEKFQVSQAAATLAKSSPQAKARADRLRDAVQPRGDGGQATSRNENDDFEAGFNSR